MKSKIPAGHKVAATMCVLRHGQQFLLLKRAKPPHQNCYTPVGGKLEQHESPKAAAIREVREETGIELENMTYCGVLTETSPVKYNWICYVYVADIDFKPPPPCDEGILEWIEYEQILKVPTPTTDWFIYKYILEKRPFAFDAIYDEAINLLKMEEEIEGVVAYEQ